MVLENSIGLIGDLVNTFGILKDLTSSQNVSIIKPVETDWFYDLITPTVKFKYTESDSKYSDLDLGKAFQYGCANNLHMSQCYHVQFGLPTPEHPIRPELNVPDVEVPIYDYILAPFSRSLPEEQKWSLHKWQELGWQLEKQGYSVCVFGNSKYDQSTFGLTNEYDRPMNEVLNIIKKCRKGVVSIVTGISHLAYAMNTKNILLSGQGDSGWGINPDGYIITGMVCDFTKEQVLRIINEN